MTQASVRDIPEHDYVELFFDLVFVFGVSQLSNHLSSHLSWRGMAETLVMLVAMFAVWLTTSWSATIISTQQPGTRWLILTTMLLGLFMNASITRAFTTSGWQFVVPLVLIQVGRAIWTLANSRGAVFRDHYFRVLLWASATAPIWIAGAVVGPGSRLLWWALAAGIDTLGKWLAHPIPGRRLQSENVPFDVEHVVGRCRLFLLIVLGETVFSTGTAIAAAPMTPMTIVTGTVALGAIVALWALNFGHSTRLTLYYRQETSDPVRTGRSAVNALLVMVAGVIAVAVASELIITHPHGDMYTALSLLLFGGPILYLLAQGWYLSAEPQDSPRLRLLGSAALILLGFASLTSPPYVAFVLVGASLIILVLLDQYGSKKAIKQRSSDDRH